MRNRSPFLRGFTLVEIMVVVVIIGLLAALAIPAFQRVQRAAQNARVINDFRVFSQAFEQYNGQYGVFPNNAGGGVVPTSPYSMATEFRTASWTAVTAIGGRWNWDNSLADASGYAGIAISRYTCTDLQLEELDAKMDDGDLGTGNFQRIAADRVILFLSRN